MKTPFEERLELALEKMGCSLGTPTYRKELLLGMQVDHVFNPPSKDRQTREIEMSPDHYSIVYPYGACAVKRRTANSGLIKILYDICLDYDEEKLDTASPEQIEQLIAKGIAAQKDGLFLEKVLVIASSDPDGYKLFLTATPNKGFSAHSNNDVVGETYIEYDPYDSERMLQMVIDTLQNKI